MLAEQVEELRVVDYLRAPAWVAQRKVDGHRRLIRIEPDGVRAFNRSGCITTLPGNVLARLQTSAFSRLSCWLDGELLDGVLWVFDLAAVDGLFDTSKPFAKRLTALEALAGEAGWTRTDAGQVIRLLPTAKTTEAKLELFHRVREERGEGIILRRVDDRYKPGPKRSRGLLKVKFRKDVDCFVTDFGRKGHDNLTVSVYDKDGEEVEIGEVTAQAGDGQKIKAAAVGRGLAAMAGVAPAPIVITVRYLYASNDRRLVQPTLPRLRTDKPAEECLVSQLVFVNKEVRS